MDFETYSREHRHFLSESLPPLLDEVAKPGVIADIGCGDGSTIWALGTAGRLGDVTFAIDLSPQRVEAAEKLGSGVKGLVGDATAVPLPDHSVDGVIVSQVIEHLADDALLAPEIARLLRPGGWFYVGSVLRGPRAWWIYRSNGRRWLDPTHVREYGSCEELTSVLEHPNLTVTKVRVEAFRFPISDLIARGLAASHLLRYDRLGRLYVGRPGLARMRKLALRIPGYSLLEVAGEKQSSPTPSGS